MTFEQALTELKNGKVLTRKSWIVNGITMIAITKIRVKGEDVIIRYIPRNPMELAAYSTLPGNQHNKTGDLLASDWLIFEDEPELTIKK